MPSTEPQQNGAGAAAAAAGGDAPPADAKEPSPKKAKMNASATAPADTSLTSLMQDYDPATQAVLKDIDRCQTDIDKLNEKASDEILTVEHKYNQLRRPHFDTRAGLISKVDNFWLTTFVHHPQLSALLSEDDEEVLRHITKLEVEEFEDIKSGYRINFHFSPNKWFDNATLAKEFHMGGAEPTSKSTEIKWKADEVNLVKIAEKRLEEQKAGEKRPMGYQTRTFFTWFVDNEDASCDDIAEAIKDDLWPNPLQYYLISEDSLEADGLDDDDDDDDDEVDDDEEVDDDDEADDDEGDDGEGEEDDA